jgi:hypothetical protein
MMSYANWYVQAVTWLDAGKAENVLLGAFNEPEYEGESGWALVRRIQAKIALPEEKAKTLEASFADIMARNALMGLSPLSWTTASKEELSKVAGESLNQNEIDAFQDAIAKGFLPVADDREGQNSKTPDCCSSKSTTKRRGSAGGRAPSFRI